MIELLFIVLFVNLIYALRNYNVFINPSTSFIFGLTLAVLMSILYKDEWGMDKLHMNTFVVIASGVTVFNLACSFFKNTEKRFTSSLHLKKHDFRIGQTTLGILVAISLIITIWEYLVKLEITGASTIGDALFQLDYEYKQGDQNMYEIPILLRNLIMLRDTITFYFLYVFARVLVLKNELKERRYFLIICLIGVVGSIFSGSRGNTVTLLLYFGYVWSVFKARQLNYLWKLSIKRTVLFGVLLTVSVSIFVQSTKWVGRSVGDLDYSYYFAIYCGAEIKNLDLYMNEPHSSDSKRWGQHTFSGFLPKEKDAIEEGRDFIQFRTYNGYALGNVYTIFQDLWADFGMAGVVILTALMAIIMQLLFNKALTTKGAYLRPFDFYIFLYSYLSVTVLYSFFSDRFYGRFNYTFLKMIIELLIFAYLMEKKSSRKSLGVTLS